MYAVTAADSPQEIDGLPQSSMGAPCPMVLAGEHSLHLAYYLEAGPADWDGTSVRAVSERGSDEPCALIAFKMPYAHMFGPPNDEAFSGHPLAARGLRPYGVFEVAHSSWLHGLERMNSVHPNHMVERFAKRKHYIFSFHDTTFECIAEEFALSVHHGNVWAILSEAVNRS